MVGPWLGLPPTKELLMAKFQKRNSSALQPIPRVVDNTDAMAIKQFIIDKSHRPKRKDNLVVDPDRIGKGPNN